jgi:hypothetical protein
VPRHRPHRALAGALAAIAIAVPAAVARPIDTPNWSVGPRTPSRSDAAPAPTIIRTIDDGFDWASAGIGASAAAAIVLLSLGAFRAGSRARVRPTP